MQIGAPLPAMPQRSDLAWFQNWFQNFDIFLPFWGLRGVVKGVPTLVFFFFRILCIFNFFDTYGGRGSGSSNPILGQSFF